MSNFKTLFREQRHRFGLAFGLQMWKTRAQARAHTLASFPPDGVRGGRTLRVWVMEYMYICDPGHFRCRCRFRTRCRSRPEPSVRFAPLRARVFGPRVEHAPVAGAGEPSPLRCPRDGRCGAEAPVAHASSQVLGARRRGFPRVAVLRLAPLRCARSTRPPLGPLCDLWLRRRSDSPPHLRAEERTAHAPQRPCKRF